LSLTVITITGTIPGGSGTLCVTRSGILENGVDILEPEPVCGVFVNGELLAQDGQSPFTYYADNDLATTPTGLYSVFQIQVDDAPLDEFSAIVPYTASGGTIDLSVLREAAL
jgi:hypothetical protein